MINPHQHLIKTGPLSRELEVSVPTLCRWTTEDSQRGTLLRSCMVRRGWYSVPRLRAAGLLVTPPTPKPDPGISLREDLVRLAELCLTIAGKLKDEAEKR